MSSRRIFSIVLSGLILILLLGGGIFFWKTNNTTPANTLQQPELSEYDIALRAEPYFWTCTEQVEYYWGGVEQKLQELLSSTSDQSISWEQYIDSMYEFYAFSAGIPLMKQERYQKIVFDRFAETTGASYAFSALNTLVVQRSVDLFEEQVQLYYDIMSDVDIEKLADSAQLEAFLYGDGLIIVDMILSAEGVSEGVRFASLDRLAHSLGMSSWSEMNMWLGSLYSRTPVTESLQYPVGLAYTNYHVWFNTLFAPMVIQVAQAYQQADMDIVYSPMLRQVLRAYVDDSSRRDSRYYYRPIAFHQPQGKYMEVLRACMTPILDLDEFYRGHLQLVVEIVRDASIHDGLRFLLQPARQLSERYADIKEAFIALGVHLETGQSYGDREWEYIEKRRMEQLFADMRLLSTEEQSGSDTWQRIRSLYVLDKAEIENVDTPLIVEEHDIATFRMEQTEAFVAEMGWDLSILAE